MKIVIAGGSGFIGRALCASLSADHHRVTVLSRAPDRVVGTLEPSVAVVGWDAGQVGAWAQAVDHADAVINLAGEPIADGRWTARQKRRLVDSRVAATTALVEAMRRATGRPRVFVSASGVGYYGPREATPVTERTPRGEGFLADLSEAWERAARQAARDGIRVVCPRIGMVLGRDGGALSKMLPPFKLFVGGPIAPGTQWVSWIHLDDLVGLVRWAIERDAISGPVNAVAPRAATMAEFCSTLAKVLRRPSWLPVPELVLRLRFGDMASLLTTGQRVEPRVALDGGYAFTFPTLAPALEDLLKRDPLDRRTERHAA